MTYRSSSSDMDTSDRCPRCGGPLPRVIYGLPTSAAVNEPDNHGIRPVVAGCIVKSVRPGVPALRAHRAVVAQDADPRPAAGARHRITAPSEPTARARDPYRRE